MKSWLDRAPMPRWLDRLLTRLWERRSATFWLVLACCLPGILVVSLLGVLAERGN